VQGTISGASTLAMADVKGDGRSGGGDLGSNSVAVLLGQPNGQLGSPVDQPTPVALSFIDATWSADGVALRWAASSSAGVTIERSDTPVGPWVRIAANVTVSDGILTAVDRDSDRSHSRYYRIIAAARRRGREPMEPAPTTFDHQSHPPTPAVARERAVRISVLTPQDGATRAGARVCRDAIDSVDGRR
jgi:hypothetical protein